MRLRKVLLGGVLLLTSFALCDGMLVWTGSGGQTDTEAKVNLKDGLVAYWSFDEGEGDVAFDYSGNYNDAGLMCAGEGCSPPEWREGKIGLAVEFDGVDDFVDGGNDDSLAFELNDFSIAFWVKTATTQHGYVMTNSHTGNNGTWYLNYYGFIRANLMLSNEIRYTRSGDINDDKWHHITAVYDRDAELTLYIDSVLAGNPADISDLSGYSMVSRPVLIGVNSPGANLFKGTIDEVRIYNRALREDEIKALYEQGQEE